MNVFSHIIFMFPNFQTLWHTHNELSFCSLHGQDGCNLHTRNTDTIGQLVFHRLYSTCPTHSKHVTTSFTTDPSSNYSPICLKDVTKRLLTDSLTSCCSNIFSGKITYTVLTLILLIKYIFYIYKLFFLHFHVVVEFSGPGCNSHISLFSESFCLCSAMCNFWMMAYCWDEL